MAKHNREHPRTVIWVPSAYCMFDAAVAHIADGSTTASENFVEDVLRAADLLELYGEDGRIVPELGRPEMREITVGRYRLQYHLAGDTAEIVALMPAR